MKSYNVNQNPIMKHLNSELETFMGWEHFEVAITYNYANQSRLMLHDLSLAEAMTLKAELDEFIKKSSERVMDKVATHKN